MTAWRSLLPIVGAFALLAVLGALATSPADWPVVAAAAAAVVGATEWLIVGRRGARREWLLGIVPLLALSLSAVGLLLFVGTGLARQLVLVAVAALAALGWESKRRYVWEQARYHPEQLENAWLLVSLAAVWTTAAFVYRLLLDPTILPSSLANNIFWVSTLCVFGLVFTLERLALWARRYERARVQPLTVVTSLLTTEFFWLVNFLPHAPDVKAFIVATVYYGSVMLGRAHLDGTLNRRVARRYVVFAAVTVAIVLATAQWVV